MPQPYPRQVLDHLGLVAGIFDELGTGEVLDQATQQTRRYALSAWGTPLRRWSSTAWAS